MDQHNYSEHNKTSVKVHHEPGGGSQWSISGGYNQPEQQQQNYNQNYGYGNQEPNQYGYGYNMGKMNYNAPSSSYGNRKSQSYNKYNQFGDDMSNRIKAPEGQYDFGDRNEQRTSVKVHHAPGGKTSVNVFADEEPKTMNII